MQRVVNQMENFTDDASVMLSQNMILVNLCVQMTTVVKVTLCTTGLGVEMKMPASLRQLQNVLVLALVLSTQNMLAESIQMHIVDQ